MMLPISWEKNDHLVLKIVIFDKLTITDSFKKNH